LAESATSKMVATEEKCVGCRICQLKCSFIFHQRFVPSEAYIQIEEVYGLKPIITFLDDCTKCGQCAKYCPYGALELKGES